MLWGWETFLLVQRLRLHALNSEGLGSVPGQRTRSHMPQLRFCIVQLNMLCAQWRLKIPRATTKTWSNQIHMYIHSHFFLKSMLWGSHRNRYSNGLDLRSPGRQSIQDTHPPVTTPSTHCSPLPLSTKVGPKAAKHPLISTAGEKQICLLASKI